MSYATSTDITDLYGVDALVVAVRDVNGEADGTAIDRALTAASGEIDSYIATRYALPLPSVPVHLVTVCVDIALYRLALSADVLTDEIRRRYEDARSYLRAVADGKAALQVISSVADPEDADAVSGPRPIFAGGPERLFSREKLRDI